jgi:hypothetical protein
MGAMPQGVWSLVSGALQPLADRPFADTQGLGDLALGPALFLEVPGLQPACFLPVVECRVHAWKCMTGPPGNFSFQCSGQ